MNVLVIGGGAREHALCHALARSVRLRRLFILPGNVGTEALGTNIAGDAADVKLALDVARRENIGLTIVGPEDPLARGIVDAFQKAGRRIFGPTQAAARLESDKVFAKQLMRHAAVPTAEFRIFDDYALARKYIATRDDALVVKASGLARGKGVIVCEDPADAILAAERILADRIFGDAGARIIVEERLRGREVSLQAIVSGHTIYLLEPAQDYKRLRDGDQGPNTGGMGSFSPTHTLDAATLETVQSQILVPIVNALVHEGVSYCGVLYAGLMLTHAGPKVLEFNCRFGDPEAQVLMLRLRSDLLTLLDGAVDGRLEQHTIEWDSRAAVCVVMAADGYPDRPRTGDAITGLPDGVRDDLAVFHAGTRSGDGRILTSGGRVLSVTALGDTLEAARSRAYTAVQSIRFEGAQYRSDIALSPPA